MKTIYKNIFYSIGILIFLGIYQIEIFGESLMKPSEWINLSNNDIYLRFVPDSVQSINLEMKLENLNIPNSENLNTESVIFVAENQNIVQFKFNHILNIGEERYIGTLSGNNDFFKDNNIKKIIIKTSNKSTEYNIPKETSEDIDSTYKSFLGISMKNKATNNDFNRISIGFIKINQNQNFNKLNGIDLRYIHGFRLAKAPIFIETGVDVSYATAQYVGFKVYYNNQFIEERKHMLNYLSISVPVSISYRLKIGKIFSFQPYTGINLKTNPIFDYSLQVNEEYEKINYFDYSVYSEVSNKKLFQMGWQIGLGLIISKFYIGFEYGINFLPTANYIFRCIPCQYFRVIS